MNFKSISLSAMLMGTATAIVAIAPAQAASIGGKTLGLGGTTRLENPNVVIGGTSRLNFSDFSDASLGTIGIPFGSGNIFGAVNTAITVQDFGLKKTGENTWELASMPITNWLTGMDNSVSFDLSAFNLERIISSTGTAFEADIAGIFRPSNLGGTGGFTAQGRLAFNPGGSTFSADITAGEEVPTPALLPGLVGMGVAALRKRKSEEEEAVEA
ncbi:MAG: hypothetical protein DCF25_05645 [Leptolyngbya foveolarum]|uniref:PTPA-CTERM sorting domain-containing protein n=1 Tax=Leptolyngbya foveolarum TaxID=47253 RepID=A0A2W4UW45_9CYAN|nr:MAG: hypothetical protein DCF25_05645 [Leptolyngbya foveolarum]